MARPAKNLATIDPSGEVLDPAEDVVTGIDPSNSFEEGAADIALETALMQLGQESADSARVIIYRCVKESGKIVDEWLHETTPGAFSDDGVSWIAREWGGGTYRVRIFMPGERGFRANKVIRVAAPKDTAPAASQSAGLGELANVMMQGFQKLGELIVAGQQKPAATEEDMLRKMAMYKELFAPPPTMQSSSAGESISTMMDMFKQGMELGRMGGGEPSSMDVLMKGLETLGPIAQQVVAKNPQMHAPAPALAQNPTPMQSPEQPDMDIRAMMLKQSLAFLVAQARKGCDPYTYANMVLDQLSDEEVATWANRPDWLDQLAQVDPAINDPAVKAWFHELRKSIMELLTGEAENGIPADHATIEPAAIAASPSPDKSVGGDS